MPHQMNMPVAFLTKSDQTAVGILPRLATVDVPSMMDIKFSLTTTTTAKETVTAHDFQTSMTPTGIR